jgi:hypothetical protein
MKRFKYQQNFQKLNECYSLFWVVWRLMTVKNIGLYTFDRKYQNAAFFLTQITNISKLFFSQIRHLVLLPVLEFLRNISLDYIFVSSVNLYNRVNLSHIQCRTPYLASKNPEGPKKSPPSSDFLWWHFPTLVMFKTGASRFFDSPPCASGTTVNSLLTASRRQLACLHLFSQWLA